jgi:hypothetical protein
MKNFFKIFSLIIAVTTVIILQAFDYSSTDSDKNPNIDSPPLWIYEMRSAHQYTVSDMPVVTTPDGYDNYDLGTDFAECNTAMNPRNPLWIHTAYNTNGTHWTTDGGLTWGVSNPSFGGNVAGDPVVAYDSLGNLYYDNMKSPITGTWIAKSTNGGQSWVFANVTANTGNDKNWIACDQTAGPYTNYIYGAMTNSPCSFSRSTNGGASFTLIGQLSPHALPGAMPCVGPNGSISGGSVYVVTSSGSAFTPTYTFFRSTNGGATLPTLQSSQSGWVNTVGTQSGGRNSVSNMRTRPYPFIAADNSFGPNRGRFYCVYSANDPPGNGNKPDVFCRYSTDFGVTFSAPVKINDDASTQNNNQWHSTMWCDKETGKIYVAWMDTRNTPTSDSAEIYASYSSNGGVSWVTNIKVSNRKMKIDCSTCGGGGTPRYQGDYNGIISNSQGGFATWADFRNGSFGSYGAYVEDYAMTLLPSVHSMTNVNDSDFSYVSVPRTRQYSLPVTFTASFSPNPGAGTLALTLLNKTTNTVQNTLTTFPDSLRIRIKATGGVTPGNYTVTVVGRGPNGTPVHSRSITVTVGNVGLTNTNTGIPEKFFLYQNYPNPFNPVTNVKFDLAKTGLVKLTVYDVTGKAVSTLHNGVLTAGSYSYDFNALGLASGVYFYKIETPDYTSIKKMMLIK